MTDREMLEKLVAAHFDGTEATWRVFNEARAHLAAPATEHPAAKRWRERPAEEHRFIDRKLRDGCMAGLGVNAADALEALAERSP